MEIQAAPYLWLALVLMENPFCLSGEILGDDEDGSVDGAAAKPTASIPF